MLTIEELCFKEEEKVSAGKGLLMFSPLFQNVLTLLYNLEDFPVEEDGILMVSKIL